MQLNHNGTFFNNMDLLPMIGYTANGELQDKNDRKDHDLPPKERMPRLTDDSLTRMQHLPDAQQRLGERAHRDQHHTGPDRHRPGLASSANGPRTASATSNTWWTTRA
jgi:hypothetical protein